MRLLNASTCALMATIGVGAGGWNVAQHAPPAVRSFSLSSSSRVASPTVVSTYVARDGELVLLVLWRGSPGWFMRGPGGNSQAGGGDAGNSWAQLSYGGLTFRIEIDGARNAGRLLGHEIALADANVVLVDHVDSKAGPVIAGLEHVDPALPASGDPALTVLQRQPELVEFLQCDLVLPDPAMQAVSAMVCAQTRK